MSDISRLEALLRRAAHLGAEVRLVPKVNEYYGDVEFYAHILGHDSDTVDLSICPRLALLELQRGAAGVTGQAAETVSARMGSRQPV